MGSSGRLTLLLKALHLALRQSEIDPERRQSVALYLLVVVANVPGATAARAAGCTKQNVSKLLRRVQDRRDDPAFDAALSRLEAEFMEGVS